MDFKSLSRSEFQPKTLAMRWGWRTWGVGTTTRSYFFQWFYYQYVHIYVHQWHVILLKWGTNGKKQACDYSCRGAKHGALHACSISLLFKGFEGGLSWFEMTCSVWTVFCCVSQCGFTWNSYFIPEVPYWVFTEFHQMWDIIMHCAVGFICVCRC